jgi:hypothetical protein
MIVFIEMQNCNEIEHDTKNADRIFLQMHVNNSDANQILRTGGKVIPHSSLSFTLKIAYQFKVAPYTF